MEMDVVQLVKRSLAIPVLGFQVLALCFVAMESCSELKFVTIIMLFQAMDAILIAQLLSLATHVQGHLVRQLAQMEKLLPMKIATTEPTMELAATWDV